MLQAMWAAASGMRAEQWKVDILANNLANVNTAGFKGSRAAFADLLYRTLDGALGRAVGGPGPVQVGTGVRLMAAYRDFTQGNLLETGRDLDLAVDGRGFFMVELPDGRVALTRDGNFGVDAEGNLVDARGNRVLDDGGNPIELPTDARRITIDPSGRIVVQRANGGEDEAGVVGLASVPNPDGLEQIGDNLWMTTAASGDYEQGAPGDGDLGLGLVRQGFVEGSNVQVVQAMVDLITAQRAYEMNAKAIQASDEMLGIANGLRR
ncbi:MAG: flagellar basal-body rod protein FlgG [Clostridia bacterium]|nr:flagellar basal-body rod protein FlgG [Clostridia bacterium]